MTDHAVRFVLPSEALRAYVSAFYFVQVEGEAAVGDLLHPEWANIRFALDGVWMAETGTAAGEPIPPAALFGPTSRTVKIICHAPGLVMGIGLLPRGFARLFDIDAGEMADRIAPLSRVFPEAEDLLIRLRAAADDAARATLAKDILLAHLADRPAEAPLLAQAHQLLLDPNTRDVAGFAAVLGVSVRHLTRLCRRLFGLPPKLLLQRQRFLRTLGAAQSRPDLTWSEVLDLNYYDQSHFVSDFQRFMGMSPRAYFALPRPFLSHAMRGRLETLGAAFQGLHPQTGESDSSKSPRPNRA